MTTLTAAALRDRLVGVPYYRLIHAEADGLPGVIVDRFGDSFVVQVNTAGMDALTRIARTSNNDMARLKFVDMTYYVLRNDGAYAGVSLWEGYSPGEHHQIAVHDGTRARAEDTVTLFKGWSEEFPPTPSLPPEPVSARGLK